MKKIRSIDDMLAMADELYEADYMTEAIALYRGAMLRQEPSKRHLRLLSEAERLEKFQFLRKLLDLYPESMTVKLSFAEKWGGTNATKNYSELIDMATNNDMENKFRYQRWRINCKTRRANHEQMLEDFTHLWQANWQKFQSHVVRTFQWEFNHTTFIPYLEELTKATFITDEIIQVIEAKISFLRVIEEHDKKSDK